MNRCLSVSSSMLLVLGIVCTTGSAAGSPIVANGNTYPAWMRVVATVQVAPQSQQPPGTFVSDQYHATFAYSGATVKMQIVYYVNVDKPTLLSGAYSITPNAYNNSTVALSTATWGVLNIPDATYPLLGSMSNPGVNPAVSNVSSQTQQGAAKDSNGDAAIDIGPALGQRTADGNDSETPTSYRDWMRFGSNLSTVGTGTGALAAQTTGGVASLGNAFEGGLGNLVFVAGTFDWVGTYAASFGLTKIYYNPFSPYDQAVGVSNSSVRNFLNFKFFDGAATQSIGLNPYNVANGAPGGSVLNGVTPFHNSADLWISPDYTPSATFGTYFNDANGNGYGLNSGILSSVNTQFFGIDGISFSGGVTIFIEPEPSSMVLLGIGCMVLVGVILRRRS